MPAPTSVIVAATPITGHTLPLLQIAEQLGKAGHRVTALVGSRFAARAEALGAAKVVTLSGMGDYDDRRLAELHPERAGHPPGPPQLNYDIGHTFADPIPDQHSDLQHLLQQDPGAVVVTDQLFLGAWPTLLGAPGLRPRRLIAVGVLPLYWGGRDSTPFGPAPADPGQDQTRANLAANIQIARALAEGQARLAGVLAGCGATDPVPFLLDAMASVPDALAQLTVPELEFPRSDAPTGLRFVGPLPAPEPADGWSPPTWWDQLPTDRPVVVVTQGTIANTDLSQLVEPALQALADQDVVVVATTGRDSNDLGVPVPANAHVADYIPYSHLFPRARLLITNGGYGATQQAITHGMPVIVAGATEDKPAVAARVARLGFGRDLATDTPSVDQIRSAVAALLADTTVSERSAQLATAFQRYDAFTSIKQLVDM